MYAYFLQIFFSGNQLIGNERATLKCEYKKVITIYILSIIVVVYGNH